MNKLKSAIKDLSELRALLQGMPHSALQKNSLFESDCENIKLGHQYLSVSTDSVAEEIDLKIYLNPFLWGWMTVMNSVSDLAASGSTPLGLVLSNQWKYKTPRIVKKKFFEGAKAALKASGVALLGGDSGSSEAHCHTSTILGVSKKPLDRMGIKKGDVICIVGKNETGNGPAIALRILMGLKAQAFNEKKLRPLPPLAKMKKLRPFVRAAIDSSDGIAVSLYVLSNLNRVGFKVVWNEKSISPDALKFVRKNQIHPLLLWLSDLGDLQTLVAIPNSQMEKALKTVPDLLPIARATSFKDGLTVQYHDINLTFPADQIANCPRNIGSIRKVLKKMNQYFLRRLPVNF